MNRLAKLVLAALTLTAVNSCDDGNIIDDIKLNVNEGYIVKMSGEPDNIADWNSNKYQIVIGAFAAQDSYPLLAKKIPSEMEGNTFIFEGINPESETIELCVLNLINKKVASLATIYDKGTDPNRQLSDTIYFEAEETDAGMYATIQNSIFNKRCIFCHGLGETPAAGLYLTAEDSYKNLVGTESQKVSGAKRVAPENAKESVLYRVLTEYDKETSGWHYDHTKFFYGNTMSNLVKEWIDNGAKK